MRRLRQDASLADGLAAGIFIDLPGSFQTKIASMTEKSIFKKIIDGEIPADIIHDDACCLAFRDIAPQAPVHFLVIPKKEIRSLDDLSDEDCELMGRLMLTIRDLTRQMGVTGGYRVISNCGPDAGQTVHHLHFHVMAGRPMPWP
jgi:histidine triad (HIT) family protein